MKIEMIDGSLFKEMIVSGANNLENHKKLVDKLNVFPVPDGDTGTNMTLTIMHAIKEVQKVSDVNITSIAKAAAKGSLMGARGNSGVILSQILRGISKSVEGKERLDVEDMALAFKEASDTAYKAVIKPIEGTILTVARETGEFAVSHHKKSNGMKSFLKSVIEESNESLERTPEMLKVLKEAGVVDSGGKGLVLIYEGMYNALVGEFVKKHDDSSDEYHNEGSPRISQEDLEFGYCTEFILETQSITDKELQFKIESLGDSLIVVGDEDLIKVHIHTNNPGKALEIALEHGSLKTIKIENMRDQHQNKIIEDEKEKESQPKKEYSFVAVSMGDGIENILTEFGVDKIIKGGQTMNPSTSDFLDAIAGLNAENIILYPNNSNIIMAANQAKELSDKNVHVVPTKNIPQCFTSLMSFDESKTFDENYENMLSAYEDVKVGQITYAVRDTSMNDVDIKKDDIIGIANGNISTSGKGVENVLIETVKALVDEDSEMITLIYGSDVSEEDAQNVSETLESEYPDLDVEVYYGGQPLYYYIVSVE